MNVLGIWDGHDSGAALLQEGRLRFAVNEERLTRRKLEVRFPTRSVDACLRYAGLDRSQVDVVAVSTSDPAKTLGRWWLGSKERYYAVRRRQAGPGPLSELTRSLKYRTTEWASGPVFNALSRLALRRALAHHALSGADLRLVDHHEAHAASAAWSADFAPCSVLTIDGVGDGLSSTISIFRDGRLKRVAASTARSSLGVFFEHVTNLLNMRELEDEGKVMALADYAAPIADEDNPLLSWIRVRDGVVETTSAGHSVRRALARIQWRYPNEQFAYLAQRVVEQTCVALARDAVRLTGLDRLALAGGVVSNIRATRRIRLMPEVRDVYVFPHMGDGGLALGSAVVAASAAGENINLDLTRLDLGPSFTTPVIGAALRAAGFEADPVDGLAARVADALGEGRIVMWFQGRMEYGPRALGNRSVLARPDRTDVRDRLNLVLKRRVWYQPFCPSMLESEAVRVLADWMGGRNSCMTMAYEVSACFRNRLAGVISINGTCRPQVVPDNEPGAFAELLREARTRWSIGAVLNTSFNIHGEPIVCSPEEAIDVFLRSGADALAIGPFLVERPGGVGSRLQFLQSQAVETVDAKTANDSRPPLDRAPRPARIRHSREARALAGARPTTMNSISLAVRQLAAGAGSLVLGVLITACSSSNPTPAPPHASGLWGDLKPVVSVKELMKYMIDPVADNIFNAVGSVVTKDGVVDTEPKTDEDWEKIQVGAVSLAEGAYLLKVPRAFAPPGDLNNSTGPNAVELSPAQITAKVERDPVEWNARIETLRNASLAVLEIVKRKDASAMWEAGEILDQACENCHRSYWYPGEDAAFYRQLGRRLEEFGRQSPPADRTAKPRK